MADTEKPKGTGERREDGRLVEAARRIEVAGERASEKIHDAREKVREKITSARATAEGIKEKNVGELVDDMRDYVRRHPGRSVLMSAGAGLLLGFFFRRR